MKNNILPAIILTLCCIVFFSGVYTVAMLGIAQFAPNRGKGEIINSDGNRYYVNIGQKFTDDKYFWSRPSAVDYNGAGSGGSNKGPTNPEYLAQVQARIDTFLAHNPGIKKSDIPSELVTASGSGQDPHLSPEGAMVQVSRIANTRNIQEEKLVSLINQYTEKPLLNLFGTTKVNVLKLNIALDDLK
ncbi:MAG TPA: K(+)-transporting ATPase subunit C [Chitinophagales bacterium]|nr:K(+)-transporting ATPase subunit C [Chitinophagales bacterium]